MKRVAVLSPHLDDAVLSVGALIHSLTRRGLDVSVVTVLAGNAAATAPAGGWDAGSGFRTQGEAARMRCREDERACRMLGARPVWLPYSDEQYDRGADDRAIASSVRSAIDDADVVLVPGFPLVHADHAWLTTLMLRGDVVDNARVGFYVEQPYAARRGEPRLSDGVDAANGFHWSTAPMRPRDAFAKLRAVSAYRSQRRVLGRHWRRHVTVYELQRGGETIAWPKERK
jgi:LmbE family N-acetylglucosaminyl deacetylase